MRILLTLCCLTLLAGCRETLPTMPENHDPWRESDLPLLPLDTSLASISFAGQGGYVLGQAFGKAGSDYLLLRRDDSRHWVRVFLADPPDNAVFLAVAASATGVVLGGFMPQDVEPCLVYDERGGVPQTVGRAGWGITAVDGDDALMVAGGTASGGALWVSRTPGQWTIESTPLDPQHEGGFTDVFVGGGRTLACGFEDGADTLQVVLSLSETDGIWRKISLGAGARDKTLRCIAASPDGTLMLGGIAGAGGPDARAFVWRRAPGGAWTNLALPEGDVIGGANDIIPAPGGAWYVACGGEGGWGLATILRIDGTTVTSELKLFYGSMQQLAVDDAGVLHAVGYRLTSGAGLAQPLLLNRS